MAASTLTPTLLTETSRLSQASLRQIVCDQTVSLCSTLVGLEAIILTGSMARDEASFGDDNETVVVRGDAEFLLVFANNLRVPSAKAIEQQAKMVESRLTERNIRCKVCLSPVSTAFLEGIVPHIFGYELLRCGLVVWGNRNALARVPAFDANEIPLGDAVRLLCNRMVELLELLAGSGPLSKQTRYATIKLYLDMATSFLVFAGGYRPTYRDRLEETKNLAKVTTVGAPFSLPEFAHSVEHATRVKLSSYDQSPSTRTPDSETSEHFLTDAIQFAHQLLRWELQRLLKLDADISDQNLLARWADSQSWTSRLRGWARVFRDADTTTTRRNWMRWLRLARHTSPRQGVYFAACLLFFRIPNLLRTGQNESFYDLNRQLPISLELNERIEWRSLAASIARNYHQFVEFTRT
jgi:hypothetical protein